MSMSVGNTDFYFVACLLALHHWPDRQKFKKGN